MKKIIVFVFVFSHLSSFASLVTWDSAEGRKFFGSSQYKDDFFQIANHFTSQNNKISCGLASSVIIMNALRLNKTDNLPEDRSSIHKKGLINIPEKFNPFFKKFTQFNILSDKTKSREIVFGKKIKKDGKEVSDYGLQLHQLESVFKAYKVSVRKRVVTGKLSKKTILEEMKTNLLNSSNFILVNYARKTLGQKGGGHISPIGAYDEKSDTFLIMDVNPNKAPWVWVKSDLLIKAMNSFDTVENRGYLLIN